MIPTTDETNIIKKLQAGDKIAFNELVQLYGKRVMNTCYRLLMDREDAEDISQEVFIEVFQSIKSFRGDAKLSTWIYRIAVTRSLDEIKKRNRKKRLTSIGKLLHLDEAAHWLAGGPMPDRYVREEENMRAVRRALDMLPDNQRVAFALSKIDGYTNQEIAEIMNTSVIAVESLVHRAKKKLGTELKRILEKND